MAVAASLSWAESLRRLGMCHTGGARMILRKYVEQWGISTSHFDANAARRAAIRQVPTPLAEILVESSSYSRGHLKARLFAAGLKERRCELCGQDDMWQGRPMSLVLDHINGVRTDHRITNLRIVCPNCNATLDTHCGRRLELTDVKRDCARCGKSYEARYTRQHYCSSECGQRHDRRGRPNLGARRAERPPHAQLLSEVATLGWSATGRKYGVSDNAIRKWVRVYENESVRCARLPVDAGLPLHFRASEQPRMLGPCWRTHFRSGS